ncbi:hypothetical protein LCGC14_2297200 [marine sediment metagenome]|uniref:Uncharacterized protein n=1 Tax=marine sediment metagenome TaxID=412755 RepID=A0A0F9DC69_9ZZZZ
MNKAEMLAHWQSITPDQDIAIEAVAYKHKGSTYDQNGIRLTGSQQFIDSILSRLKELLDYEADDTRLQVVYKQSQDKDTGLPLDSYNCYIQVHERGGEACIMNAIVRGARQRIAARQS